MFGAHNLKQQTAQAGPEADGDRSYYAARLKDIFPRLKLLGMSDDSVELKFNKIHAKVYVGGDDDEDFLSYRDFSAVIRSNDLNNITDSLIYSSAYHDGLESMLEAQALKASVQIFDDKSRLLHEIFQRIGVECLLWEFAKESSNLDYEVEWFFSEHVKAGWSRYTDHVHPISRAYQFFIVTEGTSDTAIISRSINLLRPNIADFFHFVEPENTFPFTGTGPIYNFCKAIAAIRIINKTLVIFDNDAAGTAQMRQAASLTLPENVAMMHLPDFPCDKLFETVGPDGASFANINGWSAAIETYLDLTYSDLKPVIRWSSFNESTNTYQGSLENKSHYAKDFTKANALSARYDFSKLKLLVASIVTKCENIAHGVFSMDNFPDDA